jgi:ketosteroid isomerase-like protein
METEELVRRYSVAMANNDLDTLTAMRHPDWHEDWPQSGERVPSNEAYRRIHGDFPGGMPRVDVKQVAGADDRWVMTPSMTVQRIAGSGDVWFIEGVNTYPSGELYHIVQLLRLRDGRVWRSTTYFAPPFEAPAWRAALVVPMDPADPPAG